MANSGISIETLVLARRYTDVKLSEVDSAYSVWLASGHTGSIDDFLNSLKPTITFQINEDGELEVEVLEQS